MWKIHLEPFKRQIRYAEESGGLKISLRARRQDLLVYAFLTIWLCIWTTAGIKGLGRLLNDTPSRLPLWPLGWAFAEVWMIAILLFLIGGREVVTINPDFVKSGRQVFGIGLTREYFLHEVLNLRYRPPIRRRQGWLAFDYEGRTVRLVSDVTGDEAVELLGRIRQRMRDYGAQQIGIEPE